MMPNHENASQREKLIQALNAAGLKAHETIDEDGIGSVNLSILDTRYSPTIVAAQDPELKTYVRNAGEKIPSETYLHIVIKDADGSHIVGVVGQKGERGKIFELGEWQRATTLDQAVLIVQSLWTGRDVLLNEFVGSS
jgi:hypothetical protein